LQARCEQLKIENEALRLRLQTDTHNGFMRPRRGENIPVVASDGGSSGRGSPEPGGGPSHGNGTARGAKSEKWAVDPEEARQKQNRKWRKDINEVLMRTTSVFFGGGQNEAFASAAHIWNDVLQNEAEPDVLGFVKFARYVTTEMTQSKHDAAVEGLPADNITVTKIATFARILVTYERAEGLGKMLSAAQYIIVKVASWMLSSEDIRLFFGFDQQTFEKIRVKFDAIFEDLLDRPKISRTSVATTMHTVISGLQDNDQWKAYVAKDTPSFPPAWLTGAAPARAKN
jgi:hypothetical protein